MTDKDFEETVYDFDYDSDTTDGYKQKISYIEKLQQKYIETHEKIKEFDILTSVRRGEYKEVFESYINYCLEKGKKPKVKYLFFIYKEIKIYLMTNIGLDTFINICNDGINYKEFFNDFEDLSTDDNFSLITRNWEEYGNSNVNITYSKLSDILNDVEFAIEKEMIKIDSLFLEYIELIERQENKSKEGKKKALTDEQFENYKNKFLAPRKIPVPEYIEKELDEIPNGYIKSDRRTLETSVENFIEFFLVGNVIINSGILQNFNKQDGIAISPFGAQQAISRVKNKLKRK
jgi:hypothetical protein